MAELLHKNASTSSGLGEYIASVYKLNADVDVNYKKGTLALQTAIDVLGSQTLAYNHTTTQPHNNEAFFCSQYWGSPWYRKEPPLTWIPCTCNEIAELVNTTVQQAAARLEYKLSLMINTAISNINMTNDDAKFDALQNDLTSTMERLLKPIKAQLDYHLPPPPTDNSEHNP